MKPQARDTSAATGNVCPLEKLQLSRLLARRRRVRAAVPQDHAVPLVSGRRSAEQQSGQPPRWSGGDHALGAWHAGPSRLQEQAVPLPGPRRVVLHGLRDILVDDHGRSPRRRLSRPLRSALALTLMEHESCLEIHPRHCRIACGVSADLDTGAERRIGAPRTGRTLPVAALAGVHLGCRNRRTVA
jgi:hypothetical protein